MLPPSFIMERLLKCRAMKAEKKKSKSWQKSSIVAERKARGNYVRKEPILKIHHVYISPLNYLSCL